MNISQSNLCIIPARGGSKRILKKNIKDFLGKPIIAYSIEAAQNSGLFKEIMVSTDDIEIAEIAVRYGAKVPFIRSEKSSNDFAPLKDVIDEVLQFYKDEVQFFDSVCCLLPTAPLLTSEILEESLSLMHSKKFDSVRPIVRFSYPIQRAFRIQDDKVSMFNPEHFLTRSQDLEEAYHDAGMFYWCGYDKGLNGENKGGMIISDKFAQDIDTLEDWDLAEFKYQYFLSNEKGK